jgi:hypothetical protein
LSLHISISTSTVPSTTDVAGEGISVGTWDQLYEAPILSGWLNLFFQKMTMMRIEKIKRWTDD